MFWWFWKVDIIAKPENLILIAINGLFPFTSEKNNVFFEENCQFLYCILWGLYLVPSFVNVCFRTENAERSRATVFWGLFLAIFKVIRYSLMWYHFKGKCLNFMNTLMNIAVQWVIRSQLKVKGQIRKFWKTLKIHIFYRVWY